MIYLNKSRSWEILKFSIARVWTSWSGDTNFKPTDLEIQVPQPPNQYCSVIEHDWRQLSFQTAVQKNEEKLSSFVQFEKEMASYRAL